MTSQQQPRMFHVKHIDFERSKTRLLRNMSCLQLFFAARNAGAPARPPLYHSVPIGTTPTIASAPQILTKETRIIFLLYRERARWSYDKTIRAHQPHSTPSSIKPRRRLHLNARASNVSYHFRHTPQPPIFLPTTNTLPQSKPPSPQKRAVCFA